MEKISCPICTRLNESGETHCWFCHAELPAMNASDHAQTSDWLNGLRQEQDAISDNESETTATPAEDNSIAESGEYVPDWLSRIRNREAAERAEKKAVEDKYWEEKQSRNGVPDWLRSLDQEASGATEDKDQTQAAPEINQASTSSSIEETALSAASSDDWLESLKSWQSADETENLILPENPDIIESSTENRIAPQPEPHELFEILPESEIDLEKIFSPSVEEPVKEPEIPLETQDVVLPEGFQPFDINVEKTEIPEKVSKQEQDLTDLSLIIGDQSLETPAIESAVINQNESNSIWVPEGKLDVVPELTNLESTVQPLDHGEPDLAPDKIDIPQSLDQGEPDLISDEIEILQPLDQTEPDLAPGEIDSPLPQPTNLTLNEAGVDESSADIRLDPFKADEILLEPFKPDDLPEWLTDVKPAENTPPKAKPRSVVPQVDDGSLKPEKGNLPVWLASLRPVEAVEMAATPEEKNQEGEPSGGDQVAKVMAGISTAPFVGKPSDLGGGLKVNNRQKTNAALLSVIAANNEEVEETGKGSAIEINNALWRSLLAVLFIAVALLGGTVLKGYGLQPALFPGEVVHTFDRINSIPTDKTVLIAGDFEAGFAGEIRFTSESLIEHMMRRDLNIALMSINPVDSALLADQIGRGLAVVPSYQAGNKVVDLGYFPGGAIAVQDLGNSFTKTVPLTADLVDTSTQELLKSIQSMADFGAIIVITDKAETARIWIEQLEPTLGDTPLLMITSAQASPLIQPYYQSGQVSGMVSGMSGGLIYERIMGATGEAGRNHTSLQLLSVLMAALILIGGFVSLVKPVTNGGKRQ